MELRDDFKPNYADRRPKATPKCELMDEAREPAREPRDHPEVTTEVNPVGPTFPGDSTKVARHRERTPPELERRVEPMWLLMGETREPAREPQAHPEVTMRNNPICLNSAGNAAVGSPTIPIISSTSGASQQTITIRELPAQANFRPSKYQII